MNLKNFYIISVMSIIFFIFFSIKFYYYYVLFGKEYGYLFMTLTVLVLTINCFLLYFKNSILKVGLYTFITYSATFIISFIFTMSQSKHGFSSFSDPLGKILIFFDYLYGIVLMIIAFGFSMLLNKMYNIYNKNQNN